jgi:outer membrane protein OmpA-like peptidoglycan-associated protein
MLSYFKSLLQLLKSLWFPFAIKGIIIVGLWFMRPPTGAVALGQVSAGNSKSGPAGVGPSPSKSTKTGGKKEIPGSAESEPVSTELTTPLGTVAPKNEKVTEELDEKGNRLKLKNRKIQKKDETITIEEKETEERDRFTGFTLFLGIDSGYQWTSPSDQALETKKTGYYLAGKILGTFYPGKVALDLGGGWMYSSLTGSEYNGSKTPQGEIELEKVTVISQAGLLEAAARFRLGSYFQMGFALQGGLGTDLSFSAQPSKSSVALLGSLQLAVASSNGSSDLRYIAQFTSDLNIPDRQVFWALFGFQWGVPMTKPDILTTERNIDTQRIKRRTKVEEKPIWEKTVKEVGKYVLNNAEVNWETPNGSQLTLESQSFLIDLGTGLEVTNGLWQEITIEAHVNQQSSPKRALKLSQDRAAAVRDALVTVGIPAAKIKIKPMGTSVPRVAGDTQAVSPQNQRIELVFGGVPDFRKLNETIKEKVTKTKTPETCNEKECK